MISSLSILIPCYNVEHSVESVVLDAYEVGRTVTKKLEIIVLNDASSDRTPEILRMLSKRIPRLRIISHADNKGYGHTIRELYKSGGNDWLFSLPGDGQFDAGEIRKLIPQTGTADMILGYRKIRHDPKNRLAQSAFYNGLLRLLFGISLHDVNTIRLIKKSVIERTLLTTTSAFVDAELAIRMARAGLIIKEIPIIHKSRRDKGGSGGKFFKTILPTIVDMVKTSLQINLA